MKIRATILLLLAWATAGAQNINPADIAFQSGEKLEYAVSYRAKLVPNTEVADVTFSTSSSRYDGRNSLHVNAKGRVRPFFRWFFDLNDTYNCWMDAESLQPLKFTTDLREGGYRFSSTLIYDWNTMTADSKYRNLKRPTAKTKTLPLTQSSYDAIALFFNLRSTPTESFAAGQPRQLQLVLEDTVRTVQYKFLGREQRDIRGQGRFKTLKFSCQLVTSTGESFEDGSEFFLWVSDDNNKIPLYIESPIKVGSVQAYLTKYNNLKFPLDSKIK